MKIGIMQPYLFPYIGYFQLVDAVDKFVILDDVSFINRGWINRNQILINGQAQMITVPLIEASQNKLISEIELVSDLKWKEKLLKTITFNYKKSPYYNKVYALVESIILFDEPNLSKYIHNSLMQICNYLDIDTLIETTSSKYQNGHLKSAEKILDICLQENTQTYINPFGGIELYDKQLFKKKGIQLHFIQTANIEYRQFKNEFIPRLSIIDVMMFNTPGAIKKMLNNYELI